MTDKALFEAWAEVERAHQRVRDLLGLELGRALSAAPTARGDDWLPDLSREDWDRKDASGRKVWAAPGEIAGDYKVNETTARRWAEEFGCGVKVRGRWKIHRERLAKALAGL
jgi:hypothetical protein